MKNEASAEAAHADFGVASLVVALHEGRVVSDRVFDAVLYPPAMRRRSATFWTPVAVARRAVELLAVSRRTRVLDVGSGVGKFCIVGAAMTRAHFVGVEQRAHLVAAATDAAEHACARTARFVVGDFDDVDVSTFDAIYLFNPFEESLWGRSEWLDDTIAHSIEKARRDIEHAEQMLERATPGTRVATYHGFGGTMPPSYLHVVHERAHSDHLDLWVKR